MTAHTPGPWVTRRVTDGVIEIVTHEQSPYSARVIGVVYGNGNAEANAKVFAAGPKMLAALQLLRINSTRADWADDINEAMDTAIADATRT